MTHYGLVVCLLLAGLSMGPQTAAFSAETAVGPAAGRTAVTLLWDGYPVGAERSVAGVEPLSLAADPDRRNAGIAKAYGELLLAGPTPGERSQGKRGLLPDGAVLDRVRVEGSKVGFYLTVPAAFVARPWDDAYAEILSHAFVTLVYPLPELLDHFLFIRSSDWPEGEYQPVSYFLPELPPVPRKEAVDKPGADEPPPAAEPRTMGLPTWGQPRAAGALSGKTVFVSPGHGWYYNSSPLGRWATQRGNWWNVIEDLSNAEAVNQYLLQYLWNAGANVWPCRERDMNTNMDIVDDLDAEASFTGTWTSSSAAGDYGSGYRWASTNAGGETATATFTPSIPQSGYYSVYAWYVSGANRSTAARFRVNHSGGTTELQVNQQQDGMTWRFLGSFHFEAGAPAGSRSVVISNHTSAGSVVIADAVRFGGGMGDYPDGGSVSGKPRYEESGKYFSGFMGYTYANGTVDAMPRYAAWENESWEDSIYVSWHTNGASGTSRGTSSFSYASGGWDQPFDGVPGGDELRNIVHAELINDIRAGYDASWRDVGLHRNWYGELNPSNNSEMPAAIYEMAFHDNELDANAIKDPKFRLLVARAVYQGIVKWWNSYRGNPNTTLLPEPPANFLARNNGSGGIALSWNAPPYNTGNGLLGHPATSYKVYVGTNGKGFSDGFSVPGTAATVTAGLVPGTVYYFRVAALNAGGESFPTETLAVKYNPASASELLIVNGFDRLDRFMNVVVYDPIGGGDLHRGYLDRMNRYDYVIEHARAVDAYGNGVDFDSCSNEAVIGGAVALGSYTAVVWILGEESTADRTFDATEQSLVQTYLNGGGRLFVSGAEIGWDLDQAGNGVSFYNNYLRADYAADDANTYSAQGAAGGIFSSIGAFTFDNGNSGSYNVDYPDVLATYGGSVAALAYVGGTGGTAAVQYDSGTFKVVNFGFPFETITSATVRNQVMAAVLDFFGFGGAPVGYWVFY